MLSSRRGGRVIVQVVKGQQDLAVVLEVGAEGEKPRKLVWLWRSMARATSLPYNMLASTKEVSPLIWLPTLVLLLCQMEEGDAVSLIGDVWVIVWGSSWKKSHLHRGPSYTSSLPQVIPHVLQSLAQNSLLSCCM